jgi:hypothetical protein
MELEKAEPGQNESRADGAQDIARSGFGVETGKASR